jgi:hypothetical protein
VIPTSRDGRLVVQVARRGGRGASGLLLAATLPFVVGCGGAEGAAAADLEVVTRVEQGESLTALARSAAYVGVIPSGSNAR